MRRYLVAFLFACVAMCAYAHDANRLAYLDDPDPFYPSRDFPKLITPQWIGEPGVEAAVILSIDDMRDPAKYEAFLRPIIDKLKEKYGKASMSIMACNVTPTDPQLQTWLQEGLSIETHTVAHPCPLLGRGQFNDAKATYESCIQLMGAIPGNSPVAFRMPCCDSLNTLSPRFFYEIFNKPSKGIKPLAIDSSVFNITTANDPALPREWVFREDGRERFRSYLPFEAFKTTIEDYPYPYLIAGTCWEFPCAVPSDWEAQNVNKPNNPQSLADMKVALDAAVLKKGVYTLVFHPYGWIRSDQIVDLIEHAASIHGDKVMFLSFRDAYDRLTKNIFDEAEPLTDAVSTGAQARLVDLNEDGFLDVLFAKSIGTGETVSKCWLPERNEWITTGLPFTINDAAGVRFGIDVDGAIFLLTRTDTRTGAWRFIDGEWREAPRLLAGLKTTGVRLDTAVGGIDRGVRIRDIDGDGRCELIVLNAWQRAVFTRTTAGGRWKRAPFWPPDDAVLVDEKGHDNGLRLVDLDGDGDLDMLLSNQDRYAVYLFESMMTGWSESVAPSKRDSADPSSALPAIAVNGENNGAWLHSRELWVQNERTDTLPDLVQRKSFNDMLATVEPKPKSPEAALASMRAHGGLRVELVAAEPLVVDPIAIAWGADGKLWVVEMRDYPLGMDGKGKPGSRVKFLVDENGDGKYDKATVFLDKLSYATGVMPWRDGVLVTAAPLVFFAKDTNGDGKADVRETLFAGFGEGNQQHRVNGPRWGLDNWIHCANGDSGGMIMCEKNGQVVDVSGRDIRIRPDEGLLETESGNSQFGICFDDWGSRFGCANWLPVWHYALDEKYMRRNTHFSPGNPREYIVKPEQLYPTSRTLARFNDFEFANKATSTCGIEIYRDTILGPEYYGNSFVCEPVHNLVIRTVLETKGATFGGHRAPGEEKSEFLSSHDNWFRPVMARTGPDGALYIVDMYRQVIEHPEYISEETQATLHLRAGEDKGRIYRIVPVHGSVRPVPRFDAFSTEELTAQLESPNGTVRDMIQQLLIERADQTAIAPLRKIAMVAGLPQSRVQALCALDGLNALTEDDLLVALKDQAPGVRRQGIALATTHLRKWPKLASAILALQDDADPQLHMHFLYALGEMQGPGPAQALASCIENDTKDEYFSLALLSSLNSANVKYVLPHLLNWAANQDAAVHAREQVIPAFVSLALASNDTDSLLQMGTLISSRGAKKYAPAQFDWLAQYLDALSAKNAGLDVLGTGAVADGVRHEFAKMMLEARTTVLNESADENARVSAARLMGHNPSQRDADVTALGELLNPKHPTPLISAALNALLRTGDDRVPGIVLAAWPDISEELRDQALNAMLRRDHWLDALMDALEQGAPGFREVDAKHRQQLLNSKRGDIRARAEKLMASAVNPDRQAVIDQYRQAATIPGQFLRGRGIFRQRCASCHQIDNIGHAVGPDLTALTDRSPEALLVSILDPNRAVETKYFDYTVETNDLSTYNGIIAEQSANSVTLRGANGIDNTILRSNIESIATNKRSPMPDGLEDGLTPEDLANLMAFILEARRKL